MYKYIMYHYPIFIHLIQTLHKSLRHSISRHTLRSSFEIPRRPTSKVSLSFNFRHCSFNPQFVAVVPWTSQGIPTPSVCIRHYHKCINFFKILIALMITKIVALFLHAIFSINIISYIYYINIQRINIFMYKIIIFEIIFSILKAKISQKF